MGGQKAKEGGAGSITLVGSLFLTINLFGLPTTQENALYRQAFKFNERIGLALYVTKKAVSTQRRGVSLL
jgi:hypothetical protein